MNTFDFMKNGDTLSTKEIAAFLKVTTKEAYKLASEAESLGILCKYGYKTKYGWEDCENSNLKPNSLHWQK